MRRWPAGGAMLNMNHERHGITRKWPPTALSLLPALPPVPSLPALGQSRLTSTTNRRPRRTQKKKADVRALRVRASSAMSPEPCGPRPEDVPCALFRFYPSRPNPPPPIPTTRLTQNVPFRKNVRGPKKPPPKRTGAKRRPYVSIARIPATALLECFQYKTDDNLRWVLANALRTAMPYHRRRQFREIKAALNP